MKTEILRRLFLLYIGEEAQYCIPLPASGGDRRYWRLGPTRDAGSVLGCLGPDVTENRCFVSLSSIFRSQGCAVPSVFATTDDERGYLLQDLGDTSLFSQLDKMGEEEMERWYGATLDELVHMQTVEPGLWEGAVMHTPFSRRQAMWDLNYFKYECLRASGIAFDEERLEDDFEALSRALVEIDPRLWGFMYRDCQSRNVMIHEGRPWMIDYQGGRLGPCLYDAVSLLCQARAPIAESLRMRLLDRYARTYARVWNEIRGHEEGTAEALTPEEVTAPWWMLRVFRLLQVLGAYGLRGLVERRAHFVKSLPMALGQLSDMLESGRLAPWPALEAACRSLVSHPRFQTDEAGQGRLTVKVFSFSYMRGYPDDMTGNGGGFMFDCRAMHNPGRYEQYKTLTGRDEAVIHFLEEKGEVQPFLAGAWSLTDKAVERYASRGFSSLQIGFGCTGGQHRSVYCAEKTARHISERYPEVRVVLQHREQGIREVRGGV